MDRRKGDGRIEGRGDGSVVGFMGFSGGGVFKRRALKYDCYFSGQTSVRYIYPPEVLPECSMYMSKQYYMITNQHKKNLLECARKFRKSDGIFQ